MRGPALALLIAGLLLGVSVAGSDARASTASRDASTPRDSLQSGFVRAELFYSVGQGSYHALEIRNERIRIFRHGVVVYDRPVPRFALECPPCDPIPAGYHHYPGAPPDLSRSRLLRS